MPPPKKPSFEEALHRLERIAEEIEQGKIGLEESITRYEEGMKLIKQCRAILSKAEMRVQKLQINEQGQVNVTPFDPTEPRP